MSAQYQAVPTDPQEGEHRPQSQPLKARYKTAYFLKLVVITAAFCLVATFSFKAGQWSVHLPAIPQSTAVVEDTESTVEEPNDTTILSSPHVNDTEIDYSDMPGNGKYSVG